MTKRYADLYVHLYHATLRDVEYRFPTLKAELVKDHARLKSLVDQRGLPFLMVDLPALGRHLDRCLSDGQYKLSGLPGSRRYSNRVVIPKLFRGLYLLIFHDNGMLKENYSDEAIFLLRQLLYCAKKAHIDCGDQARSAEICSFLDVDCLLPEPDPWWDGEGGTYLEGLGFATETRYVSRCGQMPCPNEGASMPRGAQDELQDRSLLVMLGRVADIMSTTLGPYYFQEWSFMHGSGAVSDQRLEANRYYWPAWPEILERDFPLADCGYHSYASWADDTQSWTGVLDGPQGEAEPHSRLAAVEKTLRKPRLIASEPSMNMWCQQNIRHFLYDRSDVTWIGQFVKFTDQSQNRALCLDGSIDGSLATIDLSAASDRVSCMFVAHLFKANLGLLSALRASRTRFCDVGPTHGGIVKLRKYSTMGNATTFPVQSLAFLCATLAACLVGDGVPTDADLLTEIRRRIGKVSIFGDDIICPIANVGLVSHLLTLLDFKVNVDKSYSSGTFRESCGVDAFRGVEVTPVYVSTVPDDTPESYAALIDTSNNLYRKFLVHSALYVQNAAGRIKFPLVPIDSGVVGFQSFVAPPLPAKRRFNKGLQVEECYVPGFHAKGEITPVHDDTALLQFFTEDPDPYLLWKGGNKSRPVLKIKHRWVSASQFPTRKHMAVCDIRLGTQFKTPDYPRRTVMAWDASPIQPELAELVWQDFVYTCHKISPAAADLAWQVQRFDILCEFLERRRQMDNVANRWRPKVVYTLSPNP